MKERLETQQYERRARNRRGTAAIDNRLLRRAPVVLGAVVVLGSVAMVEGFSSLAASAAPSITVTPSTGLSKGQTVTVTGSGFSAKAIGNILQCNNDPNIPTVALGSPVNSSLSVGCSAPSYSHLVTTGADGSLSTTWTIATGTIGPPCGVTGAVITTCPSTDSAGKSPAADAANYPCPPTPAQEAAGVTCTLTFGDINNEGATAPIIFSGETTPTTTQPSATTTTQPSATTTTAAAAAVTTTTSRPSGSGGSSGSGSSSSGSSGSGSSGSTGAATSPSGSFANTGPGRGVELTALAGSLLVVFGAGGLVVLYQSRRRRPSL
jgi:hypothetical protein